jgi:hypothetical protein
LTDLAKIHDYNDDETFKAEAKRHGVPIKYLMQYIFILKNGSEKQKPDAGELGNDRRYLQRGYEWCL